MSTPADHRSEHHIPEPGESSVPEIEVDENIAPRPEEEVADVARAEPDNEGTGASRLGDGQGRL